MLAAALLLAACGSSERQAGQGTTVGGWTAYPTTGATPESDAPAGCDPPSRFNGSHADGYGRSCVVCRALGPEQVASRYDVDGSDEPTVARAYAAKASTAEFRQAVLEGCARGFELTK